MHEAMFIPSIRIRRIAAGVLTVALGFGAVWLVGPRLIDAQTRGHVELGQSFLEAGKRPVSTQVVDGYCWMNDCQGAQIAMAIVWRTAGDSGLKIVSCLLLASAIVALITRLRGDGIAWLPAIGLAAFVGVVLAGTVSVGPLLASIACFTALVIVLDHAFTGWRGRWHWGAIRLRRDADRATRSDSLTYDSRRLRMLWLAVPIFVLWANTDGDFLVGLAVFGVYIVGRAVDALAQRGRAGLGLARRMLLMLIVAGSATVINPYGPWLFGWLTHPGTLSFREALHGVAIPLWASPVGPIVLLVFVVGLIASFANREQCDVSQLAALTVVFAASLSDSRHAALFAIAACVWFAGPLNEQWARLRDISGGWKRPWLLSETRFKKDCPR